MANPNKAHHTFYTLFKNVPYTDEEWVLANNRRAEFREHNPKWAECNLAKKLPLEHRPVHPFMYGPSARNHEDARKICEKALADGAQRVEYSVWSTKPQHCRAEEIWGCRKGGVWYLIQAIG